MAPNIDKQKGPEVDEDIPQFLRNLWKQGKEAELADRFSEALQVYAKAIAMITTPRANYKIPEEDLCTLLHSRALLYVKLCKASRNTPHLLSDLRPHFSLNLQECAELAQRDEERCIRMFPEQAELYLCLAESFLLVEKFEQCRHTLLTGLSYQSENEEMISALHVVQDLLDGCEVKEMYQANTINAAMDVGSSSSYSSEEIVPSMKDLLECTMCLRILCQPLTTACGHSFCRKCLVRALGYSSKCPTCSTDVYLNPRTHPVNVVLESIIKANFRAEYEKRTQETQENDLRYLPILSYDMLMPEQEMEVDLVEPRYCAMVKRCLAGRRSFGMTAVDDGNLGAYGTEVEVLSFEVVDDTHMKLSVVGRRRFAVRQLFEEDGFRIAQVEFFVDDEMIRDELISSRAVIAEMEAKIPNWIDAIRCKEPTLQRSSYYVEGVRRLASKPNLRDYEAYSFWASTILFLPPQMKLNIIGMRNTLARLQYLNEFVEQAAMNASCTIL